MQIRVKSIKPVGPRVELILLGGQDDADWKAIGYQQELKAIERAFRGHGLTVSPQMLAQRSVDGGSWFTGTFMLHLAAQAAVPSLAFLGGWLKARMDRKMRLKINDIEAEATSVEEIEKLLKLAKDMQAEKEE
jgi:hypothetical protein